MIQQLNETEIMQITFEKPHISVDEYFGNFVFEADSKEGYGVFASGTFEESLGKKSGDGIITPIEQDISYSGFDFIEFVSDFTDPETNETRPLTDEEKKVMEKEVIEWVKSKLS